MDAPFAWNPDVRLSNLKIGYVKGEFELGAAGARGAAGATGAASSARATVVAVEALAACLFVFVTVPVT